MREGPSHPLPATHAGAAVSRPSRTWTGAGATLRTVLLAGAIAGTVEMAAVLPIQAALGNGPLRVLQSIASGIEGRRAYAGGLGSAVLGAALHLLISIGAAWVFHLAGERSALLGRRPALAGLVYGVIVWAVMQWLVLPLSAIAYRQATDPGMVATSIAVHALFFGLPLSLLDRRFRERRPG